jgi:hypothetical protein
MTHADDEKCINILVRKPKGEIKRVNKHRCRCKEDTGIKIYGMWVWIGFNWLGQRKIPSKGKAIPVTGREGP